MSESIPKRVLSWSGGKDSLLTLDALKRDGQEVDLLLTTVTEGYERISMHGVRRELLQRQAESLGIPLLEVAIPQNSSNEIYETAMTDALRRLKSDGFVEIAFGDLFLEDIREYREALVDGTELKSSFPIWQQDTSRMARRFIDEGYRAYLTCVDTEQIDRRFAGWSYDDALLNALPDSTDPCGENGEFHTFVFDGPLFKTALPIERGEKVMRDERFAYCDLIWQEHPAREEG